MSSGTRESSQVKNEDNIYCDFIIISFVPRSEAQKFMKRLYAFKTIKQILGLIDKNAGYSDLEKRRALHLALENNFVTSLTSLVVTGQEGPRVVATRKHSYDTRQNMGPFSFEPAVGATSISFSSPILKRRGEGLRRQGGGRARGGGIRGVAGSGASRTRVTTTPATTTTTISPAPSVSGCKLLLYASTYLRGQVVEITGHVRDLSSLDFGDKLASLKVEGVCRWEIFQGESQTFRQLDNKMHFAYELCFQAGTTKE